MHNHWDLENCRSDWDEIWYELLEWVGLILTDKMCNCNIFLSTGFYFRITTIKIGIKFGMHKWGLCGIGITDFLQASSFFLFSLTASQLE